YRWSGHSKSEGQKGIFQGIMKHGAPLFKRIYDDVNKAIDWVVSHDDLVDPNRIAIVGFSFGGSIALSKNVMEDTRVKTIIAGCAVHDFALNWRKLVLQGPFYIRLMGKLIGANIKRNTGLNLNQFLDALSEFTPAASYPKITKDIPPNNSRVFLAHCKDDEVVNYEMNFVKNKAMLDLSDENCLVFETGGHEFLNNTNALGAWMLFKLHNNL
ncbi:MAG: alpha/beta hydrolase family protein, partial [Candidatus Hodarchaeota archaeon]